jgi:hypothetical protein
MEFLDHMNNYQLLMEDSAYQSCPTSNYWEGMLYRRCLFTGSITEDIFLPIYSHKYLPYDDYSYEAHTYE